MENNMLHKNQLTNDEADFIISKALREDIKNQMPDSMFEKMWDTAQKQSNKSKTIRVRFYAIAAAIALMVTLTGTWFYNESQNYMEERYVEGAMALNKVSKYLNIGLSKLEPIDHYNQVSEQLDLLEKPAQEVKKLKNLKRIPVIIE
jgi:hypothetical protein